MIKALSLVTLLPVIALCLMLQRGAKPGVDFIILIGMPGSMLGFFIWMNVAEGLRAWRKLKTLPNTFEEHNTSARSMEPFRAYKVLTDKGRSPWCKAERWNLPTQAEDGQWLPGAWKRLRFRVVSLEIPWQPGLYISADPRFWFKLMKIDRSRLRVYEVEIGDSRSRKLWTTSACVDFGAEQIRLLRPVADEELERMQFPSYLSQNARCPNLQ